MTEVRAPIEFVAADRIEPRAPHFQEPPETMTDAAAADFTERRCARFANEDVAR